VLRHRTRPDPGRRSGDCAAAGTDDPMSGCSRTPMPHT